MLFLLALYSLMVNDSNACSCGPRSPVQTSVCRAQYLIKAQVEGDYKVVEQNHTVLDGGTVIYRKHHYTITVLYVFKGDGPLEEGTVLQLETAADSAACGTFLIPDETMLLEFNNYQDIYTISSCDLAWKFGRLDHKILTDLVEGCWTMNFMCDDRMDVWVDGLWIPKLSTYSWDQVSTFTVPPGTAVVGVKCQSGARTSYGILGSVTNGKGKDMFVTDDTWHCSSTAREAWQETDFGPNFGEGEGWKSASYHSHQNYSNHDSGPWRRISRDARVIWTENPADRTVYCYKKLPDPWWGAVGGLAALAVLCFLAIMGIRLCVRIKKRMNTGTAVQLPDDNRSGADDGAAPDDVALEDVASEEAAPEDPAPEETAPEDDGPTVSSTFNTASKTSFSLRDWHFFGVPQFLRVQIFGKSSPSS